ncbi:hypothetical protein Kpol_1025p23 [Vanderwaltozyma polyspora DSM 70294]|uniref:Mitochondrial import receptor subunit TOM20 n=1 Tax=Vanderwaltozyma polyspora (strain ATCC 22028 / DSM 70294 / BCRC 21397 / CBS 2163 / NBRC 10782 / NRRL Y-8283 / UCD 57-17) TaxID=436907 RepID=A7TKU8_VANPO|nr:uncharacterized protein Kpol_1025p23 [Vanderwaltozyma polyspora DSM 70294]EDO17103.1 hypothetical protein Kpol_1025p23 [Vanderwaltozyma polyspora DSM 70294]
MSQSSAFSRVLAVTGALTALSLTGYAIYFDYQRRNNPEFRKGLKRELKKQAKALKLEEEEAKQRKLQEVGEALTKDLATDPLPTDPAQREASFATNVELGERLSVVPGKELEAACKFYKALSVYPNPADLLGIYQRSVPENIYEYIVLMIAVYPPTNIASIINGVQNPTAAVSEAELAAMSKVNDIDE